MFRRDAPSTAFPWSISLNGAPVVLTWVDARDPQGKALGRSTAAAVDIEMHDGRRVTIVASPGGLPVVVGGTPTSARFDIRE